MSSRFLLWASFALVTASDATAAEANPLVGLVENATYSLEMFSTYYPADPFEPSDAKVDDAHLIASARLTATSFSDLTELLRLNVELVGSLTSEEGQPSGFFSLPGSQDEAAPYLDFTRLSLQYDDVDYGLLIGKQEVQHGLAPLYSPADVYNVVNRADPLHPYDMGTWQASASGYLGDDTLSLYVFPFHDRGPLPPETSRWRQGSGDGVTALQIADLDEESVSPVPDNWGYLVRYLAYRPGFDFFGGISVGPSFYPVVKQRSALEAPVVVFPTVVSGSMGFAIPRGAWKLFGESFGQVALHGRDQDFIKLAAGVSRTEVALANLLGLDTIEAVVEAATDIVLDEQSASGFILSSEVVRPFENAVLLELTLRHSFAWSVLLRAAHDFSREESFASFGIEHRATDDLTLMLTATILDGADDSLLGQLRRNDSLEFALRFTF